MLTALLVALSFNYFQAIHNVKQVGCLVRYHHICKKTVDVLGKNCTTYTIQPSTIICK